MWRILDRVGFNEHIINLIRSMYRDTVAKYEWEGIVIDEVKSERGLRQGCTLSPLLFTLIMEELTQRVKKVGVGVKINQEKLCILVFADDVILLAESMGDLQKLLDEVEEFSRDIKLQFGIDKCKILPINMDVNEREANKGRLLGEELDFIEEYKYLGLIIDKTGLEKERNGRRKKAEKMYGIINGKINCRANKYEVMRGLWKGIAVPTIMYGMEIIDFGKKEEKGLEIVQNRAARRALGANKHVGMEALRGEMGWSSFEERIDKAKIKYRLRLEHMNEKRWAKKVFKWRKGYCKFGKETKRRMNKINMKISEIGENREIRINEEEMEGEGEKKIANRVNKEVKNRGLKKWVANMEKKPSLNLYKAKEKPRWDNAYNGTWEASLLFKARTNTLEVNERKKRWGGENEECRKCEKRGERITETLEHVITECGEYTEERRRLDINITNKLGQKWDRRKREEDRGLKTILGMQDRDEEVIKYTKKYLKEMWAKRNKKEITKEEVVQRQSDHNYI